MNYCGIDIGGTLSYIYLTDKEGRKKKAGYVDTSATALEEALKPFLRSGLSVAIEAGNQTAWIHDKLKGLGAKVWVVNPAKVRLIAESRQKTDKVDAKVLCELLRIKGLPRPVHMPGRETRSLRGLLAARRQLVRARVKLNNVVRGLLRQEGIRLQAGCLKSPVGWQRLMSRTLVGSHWEVVLEAYFQSFLHLTRAIRQLEKELAKAEKSDERARRLRTIPGVGWVSALTFLSAVDKIQRFPSSRKLVGYSGLAPTVRESSERTEYGPITREGRKEIRGTWVEAAHRVVTQRTTEAKPLQRWYWKVAKRRGNKTAIVALTRKLLTVAYQMLKSGTDYDPARIGRAA